MDKQAHQIVFFDGVCNLCNGFIDFLISRDSEGIFQVASLQGVTARSYVSQSARDDLQSVVLWAQGQTYSQSDAILMILPQLGGGWFFMKMFWIFPKFIRDFFYQLIAKNRYRLFGKKESCRLPTREERSRFLD
ncbi:MAG: DCC1-like thiol-disulfide oxidoreductase family protein [Oligoflexia bacterium]|nr:DCC1-like thiol-disulfide oxidoreductase family protein [Oligoflexia bacterium]